MNELIPSPKPAPAVPEPLFGGLVPAVDVDEFLAAADDARSEFSLLVKYLHAIQTAECKKIVCQEAGESMGLSWKTVFNRVSKYNRTRDWRSLMNCSKAGAALWRQNNIATVPRAAVEFYKSLAENYRRVDKGGYRELVKIYQTHRDSNGKRIDKIPGYTQWPAANAYTGLPRGWSYKNLQKLAAHHPYDKALVRISDFAASQFRPPVLTSRVGLKLLEMIQTDDHEYNVKSHFPGQSKVMRPRGFNAIDALVCHTFAKSFKPTLWDAELAKKQALTEIDFQWFMVHILTDIGYRTDDAGTTVCCENGTAAIRADFEARIHAVTNGHIKISRGSMMSDRGHAGQFEGDAKGNFKHKAIIEGSFNLIDNYFSNLPGETGLDRNHFPADTSGREKYMGRLLKQTSDLPIEKVAGIKLPLLTWSEFLNKALEIYDAIAKTRDHQISDWEQCGFTTFECRWDDHMPWVNIRSLPPAVQQAMIDAGDAVPKQAVRMSRLEAYKSLIKDPAIKTVPPVMFPILMGPDAARELTVTKQGLFEFVDSDYGSTPFRYLASARTRKFVPGQTFSCYVNPWNPQVLVACDASGRVQGLCEWYDIPCKNDVDGIKQAMGRTNHFEAVHKNEIDARHLGESQDRAHMLAHNDAIIAAAKANEPSQEEQDFRAIANAAIAREANL